jgi:L-ascorbate metabolism protein UlaG (beta-lactamase superfamily)
MHIIWRGQACFEIITSPNKGTQTILCIDPFGEELGLRVPTISADIALITHAHFDHNNKRALKGNPFFIEGPGEYELKGVFIQGIPSWHDTAQGSERGTNTIYVIEAEEIKLCHLGDLGQRELTDEQLEQIGEVDILMIPVGGVYTVNGPEAAKIIAQIEPRIVIPMHYALPKLKVKLEGVEKFLKAMGAKDIEAQAKLTIKKKDLPEEETKVVVLKP